MTNLIDLSHANIVGVQMLATGALKVTVTTQEIDAEQVGELFNYFTSQSQKTVRIKSETDGGKSNSQRLRNALFVDWQENHRGGDFEAYYDLEINKMIEDIKARIPETKYDESYSN